MLNQRSHSKSSNAVIYHHGCESEQTKRGGQDQMGRPGSSLRTSAGQCVCHARATAATVSVLTPSGKTNLSVRTNNNNGAH